MWTDYHILPPKPFEIKLGFWLEASMTGMHKIVLAPFQAYGKKETEGKVDRYIAIDSRGAPPYSSQAKRVDPPMYWTELAPLPEEAILKAKNKIVTMP